jgi:RimJ/RimL family protein N-acetyltransferase
MSLFGKNLPALTLHTERLTLRLPTQADAPALHDYYLRNRERLEPLEPTRPENF